MTHEIQIAHSTYLSTQIKKRISVGDRPEQHKRPDSRPCRTRGVEKGDSAISVDTGQVVPIISMRAQDKSNDSLIKAL